MAVSNRKATLCFIVGVLLSLSTMQAQEAKVLPRHPGDVIKFEIKFDGPNADKIKSVDAGLGIKGPIPKDQSGFRGGTGANSGPPVSADAFRVEIKIPDNIATGDYVLGIGANAAEGSAGYQDGQDFHVAPFRIENPRTFVPPSITVRELP
jgi:hypothetical protein